MPRLGEKMSDEHKRKIGLANKGKKRERTTTKKMRDSRLGNKCYAWKGGRTVTKEGYVLIKAYDHPNGINHNYIREHRYVVEKQIGRLLKRKEVVHHLGEKTDNRPHMLMAFVNNGAHTRFHKMLCGEKSIVKPEEIIFDGRLIKH